MASDQRWTGGTANRDWSAGQQAGRVISPESLTADVGQYLTDCATYRSYLSPAHHPTLAGCLKVIYHVGAEHKAIIAEAYQRDTEAAASG